MSVCVLLMLSTTTDGPDCFSLCVWTSLQCMSLMLCVVVFQGKGGPLQCVSLMLCVVVFQGQGGPLCSVCIQGVGHRQGVLRGEVQDPGNRGNVLCEVGDVQWCRALPQTWSCESD